MSSDLTYQINNQEPQKISTENYTQKKIFDFFSIKYQLDDETFFIINGNIIENQTKISKILTDNPDSLIKIYTPQVFMYKNKKMNIQFNENIKISDLKQILKKKFKINVNQPIKIMVENHDDLDHIFNNGNRSFFKYIKPNLVFKITIDKSSQNNEEYNYNNSTSSYEIKKSKKATLGKDKRSNSQKKKDTKSSVQLEKEKLPKKRTKSLAQKPVNHKHYENFAKLHSKKNYTAKYQVNNGDVTNISFTDEQASTIYDIFKEHLSQFNESDLIFTSIDENKQFFLLNSQSLVKDTFPLDPTISIFTPIKASFKEQEGLISINFKSTINEIKEVIKTHFNIRKKAKIILSIRGHPELKDIFNKGQKHLIKLIQPDLIFDIIIDEFRFILIDDVHEYSDNSNESKSFVNLDTTAEQFINNFLAKNEIQRQDGYIFCLLLDSERYILPNSILSEFKSEFKDNELPRIQITRQSINPIVINNIQYNYAFDFLKSRITVEESKKIIYDNYFFYNKVINFDDITFYIPSENSYAESKSKMHIYHRKTLELQIGYHFANHQDQIFYFSLDKTVKEARELHNWTHLKIFENQHKIKDSLNLFSSCYGVKINALKLVHLFFDVNKYSTHISLPENTKFGKVKQMIIEDSNLIEKLNLNSKKKNKNSKDFVMIFESKDISDDSIIKSFKSSKDNPIKVILRPDYDITFKSINGHKFKEKFSHGKKISEIRDFLFEKYHQRYKILANLIVLEDDCLIQDYQHCKPLLIRIADPLYYFIINDRKYTLEMSEVITAIQAKLELMVKFNEVPNHHLFDLRNGEKKFNDFDVLPSYTEIEVDFEPMKSTFIFVLPNLSKLYYKLTNEGEIDDDNEVVDEFDESDKIVKIPDSSTFSDVKKSIQMKEHKKEFDVNFFVNKKEIRDKQRKISEIKFNGTAKVIEVKFSLKKIFFIFKEHQNQNQNETEIEIDEDEKIKEFDVYMDDRINSCKKKLLTEKVTNIDRITIKTKEGELIENERFEDFEFDSEFFYEIKPDKPFNLFDQEIDQYNNRFYRETKIRDVRKTIETENQTENVILKTENRILNNDLHLYEIENEKVTYDVNEKEVDTFTIKMANCPAFKKFENFDFIRKFPFTYDSTIGDLRIVLEDVLATENFSIVFNKKFMFDDDERLFSLGNNFYVANGKRTGNDIFKFVHFETKKVKNIVAELNLKWSLKEALKVLNDEKFILNLNKKKDVKIIYRGRLIKDDEILYDILKPKHKYHSKESIFDDDQNDADFDINDNKEKIPCNQTPIFISYFQKRKI